jgi:hypothetical protein
MKKFLFFLCLPWLVWACGSANGPDQQTTFSAEYVSNLVKLEAKTSTDHYGINLNISITNIATMNIYPQTDSVGHSLTFTVYNYYSEQLYTYYDWHFEGDYWNAGLEPGFTYAGTYYISKDDLANGKYGKIRIRLNVQSAYGQFGQPFEVEVNFNFANN